MNRAITKPVSNPIRLGVNIDHVATLRNARGTSYPDPVLAAQTALRFGADGITAHLREDRRHIRDADVERLRALDAPLNLEMANTAGMVAIATRLRPHAVCLVPEKREELTTEGGLNVLGSLEDIRKTVRVLSAENIRVSLFIDPDLEQIKAAHAVGAPVIELHTGDYAENPHDLKAYARLKEAARYARELGLEVHAGHGLTYENVEKIAALPEIAELNIGHFLIAQSVFTGLGESVALMKKLMLAPRS